MRKPILLFGYWALSAFPVQAALQIHGLEVINPSIVRGRCRKVPGYTMPRPWARRVPPISRGTTALRSRPWRPQWV